jgi:DNA-binding NarL/FixJ family response regulator
MNIMHDTISNPNETAQSPLRLWVVDDNHRLRKTVVELLGRARGIECTRNFSSATEAISALASKPGPDVILLDIQMGPENGLDAVRPIKMLSRDTRVFMFTTLSDESARQFAIENGASGFLLKCFPIDQILETIRKPSKHDRHLRPRRRKSGETNTRHSAHSPTRGVNDLSTPQSGSEDVIGRCLRALRSFWN